MTIKVCECNQPSLPIGGNGCEICGGEVPIEKLNFFEKEVLHIPLPLGVNVQETIKTEDKPA